MSKVVIVDSGCANLNSVYRAVKAVGLNPLVTGSGAEISTARAVIFPGVGSFDHAMQALEARKLTFPLQKAIRAGVPFLGICLGMQLLFEASEESLSTLSLQAGLSAIKGRVLRFPANLPVPHVGWNQVQPVDDHPLFNGLDSKSYFYFTHSYYVKPDSDANYLAQTDYGFPFTSAVCDGPVLGVQFHPEKSGSAGLRLLANFGKIIADQSI